MTRAQRINARQDKIWETAKRLREAQSTEAWLNKRREETWNQYDSRIAAGQPKSND